MTKIHIFLEILTIIENFVNFDQIAIFEFKKKIKIFL